MRAKKTEFISGLEPRLAPYAALDTVEVESDIGHDGIEAPGDGFWAPGSIEAFSNAGRDRFGGGHGLSSYAASDSLRLI